MFDPQHVMEDVRAFADDEEDVILDETGLLIFVRGNEEVQANIEVKPDETIKVRVEEQEMSYRDFLTRYLGKLDVFAERISTKRRTQIPVFIDGGARLDAVGNPSTEGKALALLDSECTTSPPFSARVTFVTADAGHGKTVLLRTYQQRIAEAFLQGRSNFLFWHVDLQGRQLLRLSEALMGDLGEMRLTGLWMPAIIRLLRHRALILAIDGFDELTAEQGSTDAVGALATMVNQLEGSGTIVAASRRTFFDTEDYLRRAGLFRRTVANPSQFDQISLLPWEEEEGIAYLSSVSYDGRRFDNGEATYDAVLEELGGNEQHPMLARPFLLTQIARALLLYDLSPGEFIRGMDDPWKGVAAVVEAFVYREVQSKWRSRYTNMPYLSVEQHMQLLADVAEEMYRSQSDRLGIDIIETLATLLLDEWGIDLSLRPQILQMVRMHVLLVVPPDGDETVRAFDHPEFRDYFIAYALLARLEALLEGRGKEALSQYLSIAQLSDSTARYVCGMLDLDRARSAELAYRISEVARDEWKPSFVQMNCGTLLPYAIDEQLFEDQVVLDAPVVYSSVVLSGSKWNNILIGGGTFVNAVVVNVAWSNVEIRDCNLGEMTIDMDSIFDQVRFTNCSIDGLRLVQGDAEIDREYAPERIRARLASLGISISEAGESVEPYRPSEESYAHKQAHRLLRMFYRTTSISDAQVQDRFGEHSEIMLDELIPLLVEHGVLEERPWRGAGLGRIWYLQEQIDSVFAAEEANARTGLAGFWHAVERI